MMTTKKNQMSVKMNRRDFIKRVTAATAAGVAAAILPVPAVAEGLTTAKIWKMKALLDAQPVPVVTFSEFLSRMRFTRTYVLEKQCWLAMLEGELQDGMVYQAAEYTDIYDADVMEYAEEDRLLHGTMENAMWRRYRYINGERGPGLNDY